jgi:hypothetical protein
MQPYLLKNPARKYSTPTPRVLAKCREMYCIELMIIPYNTLRSAINSLTLGLLIEHDRLQT